MINFEILTKQKKIEANHLESEKERLLDLYQAGSISLKEIEVRLAKIRAKIKNNDDEQKLLQIKIGQQQGHLKLIEQFEVFSTKLKDKLKNTDFEVRKEIVRLLVSEVIVDTIKDELTIKHIIPGEKLYRLCPRGKFAVPRKPISALCVRCLDGSIVSGSSLVPLCGRWTRTLQN